MALVELQPCRIKLYSLDTSTQHTTIKPVTTPAIEIDPDSYTGQFEKKCATISDRFSGLGAPAPDIYPSPVRHFRMRTEFRIWHDRGDGDISGKSRCYYAMFDPREPRQPIEITTFPVASRTVCQLMTPLMSEINKDRTLSKKLFQMEFLTSTLGEAVVTLIYHRQLDEQWQRSAGKLEERYGISVIGRSRKQKIVLSKDYVEEVFSVQGKKFRYEQKENSFTQPNAAINTDMLNWCCDYLDTANHSRPALLEMYCGNGNFTLPLAQYFDRVLATEISKTGIASAKKNAGMNQVKNIEFVRLSGEETASALNGERPFRRLANIDLDDYPFSTVFVDPPRSGLDESTLQFIRRFDEIIYISCNPDTMASNIESLQSDYTINRFAIFDQFPYSPHCECGLVLKKL